MSDTAKGTMASRRLALILAVCTIAICPLTRAQLGVPTGNLCASLNNCNGHGRCDALTKTCECYQGYGASSDITDYRSPDCSLRTCPAGPAWGGIPTSPTACHTKTECSGAGVCDRSSGTCICYYGYEGSACQRSSCPNSCSGHGQCLSMREMAAEPSAFPLSPVTTYQGDVMGTTWDQDRIQGCLCDSSWPVGLGADESQLSQWFGPDCSRQHCPSGDDPMTSVIETNCQGVVADGGAGTGATGNLCHVDCANRGICDYSSGECSCFAGFYGPNCARTGYSSSTNQRRSELTAEPLRTAVSWPLVGISAAAPASSLRKPRRWRKKKAAFKSKE